MNTKEILVEFFAGTAGWSKEEAEQAIKLLEDVLANHQSDVTVTQDQIIEWVENACEPSKDWTNTYIVHIRKLQRFLRNPKNWEHAFTAKEDR